MKAPDVNHALSWVLITLALCIVASTAYHIVTGR